MKIAISTQGDFVSAHFGRCPHFTLIEVDHNRITSKETIENPGHHPGFLPEFLAAEGVTHIIAGGMGQRARQLFEERNIIPILGVDLSLQEAISQFLQGCLKSNDAPCTPRSGKGYGLDKTQCDHTHEKS